MSLKRESGFLRQSSWMVIATFVGGIMMMLVHTVAKKMGKDEYSSFLNLLRMLMILGIPGVALQTIFARQAAMVTNEVQQRHLVATTRAILMGMFVIWVVEAAAIRAAIRPLSHLFKVDNPVEIYLMLAIALAGLGIPLARGLLQGQHQFFGLGWLQISDGAGRFGVMLLLILAFGGKVPAAMSAVLVGQVMTLCIAGWMTYPIWSARPSVSFEWKRWLAEALPLTLGLGTVLLVSSIDMLFVRSLFADTDLYGGAMLTGFSIIQFIAPVSMVMFARIAKSVARAEGSSSLSVTLQATILFGALAAIGCTILPKLPLRVIYFTRPEMLDAAPLVPWYAWALVPFTVANVLVQNILARAQFRAVLWLILVPPAYLAALCIQAPHLVQMAPFDAFRHVIGTLGLASTALCLVAAWFSRKPAPLNASGLASELAPATSDTTSSPAGQKEGAAI